MERNWPEEPFTHADLESWDISVAELRRAERRRQVRTITRGVFVAAHVPDSIELRAHAVARVLKPHHVVTDRTAAWLHGVDTHVYAEHDGVPSVEVCALRWHQPTSVPGVDGRTRDLRPVDLMWLHGVCVTTPIRTAMDLGCCLRRREAFAAMVMLAHLYGFTAADLEKELGRYRRRRGVIQLRGLVGLVDPRMESPREAWTYLEIADAGLPLPEPQLWIEIDGVPTYRLDFAYERSRVCIEYDGWEAHAGRQAEDEERRAYLRRTGWTVIVLTVGDFTGKRLDRWLSELRAALKPKYSNRRW